MKNSYFFVDFKNMNIAQCKNAPQKFFSSKNPNFFGICHFLAEKFQYLLNPTLYIWAFFQTKNLHYYAADQKEKSAFSNLVLEFWPQCIYSTVGWRDFWLFFICILLTQKMNSGWKSKTNRKGVFHYF